MKLTPNKTKTYTFRIEEEDLNKIRLYSHSLGMTTSNFIRMIIKTTCKAVEWEKIMNDNNEEHIND